MSVVAFVCALLLAGLAFAAFRVAEAVAVHGPLLPESQRSGLRVALFFVVGVSLVALSLGLGLGFLTWGAR